MGTNFYDKEGRHLGKTTKTGKGVKFLFNEDYFLYNEYDEPVTVEEVFGHIEEFDKGGGGEWC